MLAGYMISMLESISDGYACARICEAPAPTSRMILICLKWLNAGNLGTSNHLQLV